VSPHNSEPIPAMSQQYPVRQGHNLPSRLDSQHIDLERSLLELALSFYPRYEDQDVLGIVRSRLSAGDAELQPRIFSSAQRAKVDVSPNAVAAFGHARACRHAACTWHLLGHPSCMNAVLCIGSCITCTGTSAYASGAHPRSQVAAKLRDLWTYGGKAGDKDVCEEGALGPPCYMC
jgi:hypothetical protein